MTGKRLIALIGFDLAAILIVAALAALAVWQVHRREWKLDLIARVEARVHAAPVPPPGKPDWAGISAASDEYRRVSVTGRFIENRATLVQASTDYGIGYWVLAPLIRDDDTIVFVNRGFVPSGKSDPSYGAATGKPVKVTGLLRLSEPSGTLLRANDPDTGRWYSRDIAAMARASGLSNVAPYFVDAERDGAQYGAASAQPIAGLTVVKFSNNHLLYAITWASLALMTAIAAIIVNLHMLQLGPKRWRDRLALD